ncbi:hypothetical protein [Parafrigoribacterium soli]|uniref:hypothetical protein n=1 Tax=Parafrigoribacterium soli TaxID=3144663 RepID=UPI0032EE9070
MRARRAASVVLAAAVLLSTAGCTFFAPQTTLKPYDPSDGVNTQIGDVYIRNVLLLSDHSGDASLLANVVNESDNGVKVSFQYEGKKGKVDDSVFANPGKVSSVGGFTDEQLVLHGVDAKPGTLFPIFVQYGDQTGKQLLVPVLDGTLKPYNELLPKKSDAEK